MAMAPSRVGAEDWDSGSGDTQSPAPHNDTRRDHGQTPHQAVLNPPPGQPPPGFSRVVRADTGRGNQSCGSRVLERDRGGAGREAGQRVSAIPGTRFPHAPLLASGGLVWATSQFPASLALLGGTGCAGKVRTQL